MIARTIPYVLASAVILMAAVLPARAAVEVGKPAPAIEATDVHGETFKLEDHKGKIVVLEWTNRQCPFVVKHYDSGNMQKLQKEAKEKGVEWITINSSADGKQGNVNPEAALDIIKKDGAEPTTMILDPSGEIGQAYEAKTTPHMFVIDAEGNVAYAGAIDSNSSPSQDVIAESDNYVMAAIDSLQAGEEVEVKTSAPYGCSVKY